MNTKAVSIFTNQDGVYVLEYTILHWKFSEKELKLSIVLDETESDEMKGKSKLEFMKPSTNHGDVIGVIQYLLY